MMIFVTMKTKLLILITLLFVNNSYALDLEFNKFLIKEEVAKRVIDYLFEDTIQNKNITVHTDTAIERGEFTKCWNKLVYDGAGIPSMRVVCY